MSPETVAPFFSNVTGAAQLVRVTICGVLSGWFSPTQAGAIGTGGALAIDLVRRPLTWERFIQSDKDGLHTSCMVLFIIGGATVFGHFMAISNIPFMLVEWVGQLPVPPMGVTAMIIFIFFIGGFSMGSMALVVVTIPFFPNCEEAWI